MAIETQTLKHSDRPLGSLGAWDINMPAFVRSHAGATETTGPLIRIESPGERQRLAQSGATPADYEHCHDCGVAAAAAGGRFPRQTGEALRQVCSELRAFKERSAALGF